MNWNKKNLLFAVTLLLFVQSASAQTMAANDLFLKMRSKLETVKDYVADVKMKIDISFMRIPTLRGKLYFKNPDKMKLERNGGISILPKKSISLTLNNLVPSGNATVIDAGSETIAGKKVRIIKVIPDNEKTDIILTKIWVDEQRLLALRTETTTRDNGTVIMDLKYDKYVRYALPDEVIFYVDVKDFEMPKGVTMDYVSGDKKIIEQKAKGKSQKGTIQISYLSYKVNTGLSDKIFEEK